MKNILIVFFLFFLQINLVFSYPKEKKIGQNYLFGDSVNVRQIPDTNSKAIDCLKIGTQVNIIEKTNILLKIGNIDDYWYKIELNGNKIGYIWGGLIADNYFYVDTNKNLIKELLLIRNPSEGVYSYYRTDYFKNDSHKRTNNSVIEIRIIENEKIISNLNINSTLEEYFFDNIFYMEYEGFKESLFLLTFEYRVEGEGATKNISYYYIENNIIKKVFTLCSGGEGDFYFNSKLTFPNDLGGLKNIIIMETIEKVNNSKIVNKKKKIEKYYWDVNNKNFVEIK